MLSSEKSDFLLAMMTTGGIGLMRLSHILQPKPIPYQIFTVIIFITQMGAIARFLVACFFLQYYITLACTIIVNLSKRILACLVQVKDRAWIHPYHNTHQGVFTWMDDFIRLDGYSLEEHRFSTLDKAEVHLWRIQRQQPAPDKQYPIIIMHGLLESASTWFLAAEKSNSLPYLLAKEGYDVWVGNNRGNRISQTGSEYHNYTIDDLVQYDQPAIIGGVLEKTGKEKVIYVGHSQGSTQFLLALSEHPHLKQKIAAFVGVGTIVSLSRVTDNKALNLLTRIYFIQILSILGFSSLLLISKWMSQAIGVMISNSAIHLRLVMDGIRHLVGRGGDNIPQHMIGVIFTHQPGGGSVNNVLHWIQCFRSRKTFSKFCYGKQKNKEIYGCESPPQYSLDHLGRLPFDSLLLRGEKDGLSSHEDFVDLVELFDEQRVVSMQLKEYNHLDYLWGEYAHQDIYKEVVAFANKHS